MAASYEIMFSKGRSILSFYPNQGRKNKNMKRSGRREKLLLLLVHTCALDYHFSQKACKNFSRQGGGFSLPYPLLHHPCLKERGLNRAFSVYACVVHDHIANARHYKKLLNSQT